MITIIYDPVLGQKLNDSDSYTYGTSVSNMFELGMRDMTCVIANELAIHSIRVSVKEGRIPYRMIQFKFGEVGNVKVLLPDHNGRIAEWPDGFANHTEKLLERLL